MWNPFAGLLPSDPSLSDTVAHVASAAKGQAVKAVHPYYPLEAEILNWAANEYSVPVLLTLFSAGCAAIFLITLFIVKRVRPNMSGGDQAIVLWFVLCKCLQPLLQSVARWC
jgi:hypothetical protein